MRVLVTGGAGYIGSHACKALALAGHEPITLDNLRTGHRWAVRWGAFEHGDIADFARVLEVLRLHKPEAVMHFAALAYVGESMTAPDLYYRTNVGGTLRLLDACRHLGVDRFIFSSTCATYGIPEVVPITEDTLQAPINPYGRSKLMAEHILKDHASAFGCGVVALRYFNAAGADLDGEIGEDHDPEPHLIPLILQAAAGQRDSISVFGNDYGTPDGTCVRDFIHVSDLAAAHVGALEACKQGEFQAFNLGTGSGLSVGQVIEATRRVTGRDIPVRFVPRRRGDPPTLVADAQRAADILGWRPTHSDLDTILNTAWNWMHEGRTRVRPQIYQS